ncbi:MAG: hypothetical protein CSA22_08460 [Deltaproteobacteria bacterium]|nr:MAG: hypothetical protein CSA22_08460 [Deltaproteobacteria bacterium]
MQKRKGQRKGREPVSGLFPRKLALNILNRVESSSLTLDRLVEEALTQHAEMEKRDRALVTALTYGVLRRRLQLDAVIRSFVKSTGKIRMEVRNILRMAVFQIRFMDRIPDSAAVNTAVNLAKQAAPPWEVKFVNALLRNVVRTPDITGIPEGPVERPAIMAQTFSFPEWLLKRWVDRWGTEETLALCEAMNAVPPLMIRVNTLKTTRRGLMERLDRETAVVSACHLSDEGVILERLPGRIPDLSAFRDGLFQVQDEAAQLVTRFLDPRPGETVLDACSGLGGKTGHMAQRMQNTGQITALEWDRGRLEKSTVEMARLGVQIVSPYRHDLFRELPDVFQKAFHRVLLDAPCSGLGVLRRNPDGKWKLFPEKLSENRERQLQFLTRLSETVMPGGVLVYGVCSMEPEETDAVVSDFLKDHPAFSLETPEGLPAELAPLMVSEGVLRTWPHRQGTDGFFAARMICRA